MQHKKWWIIICVVLLMAMFALAGCGGASEAALIGTWKLDPSSVPTPVPGNQMQQMGTAMTQGVMQNVTLDLKSDKTYTLNLLFQMSGNWTFNASDNTVTLNETSNTEGGLSGTPNANASQKKPVILTLSSDNQHLLTQDPSGQNTSPPFAFIKS